MLLLVFVALPLRGYAGAIKDLCDAHHGGPAAAHHAMDEHSGEHGHVVPDDGDKDQSGFASLCSLCSTCSVGAPVVSDSPRQVARAAAATAPIPFAGRFGPGVSLDHPDRPPLAS